MRRFFLLIALIFFIFLPYEKSHAEGKIQWTDKSGNALQEGDSNKINTGENIYFRISNLISNEPYRIEIDDDKILQYNLKYDSSGCRPADFGANEENVNTSYISLKCTRGISVGDTNTYNVFATLKTENINISSFQIKIKPEMSEDTSSIGSLKLIQTSPEVSINETSVIPGGIIKINLLNMIPSYKYILANTNNNKTYVYQEIQLNSPERSGELGNGEPCKENSTDVFVFESCQNSYDGSNIKYSDIQINTSGFDCENSRCSIVLYNQDKSKILSFADYTVDQEGFRITFESSNRLSNPPNVEGKQTQNNFYTEKELKVGSIGCQGEVDYKFYKDANINCNNDSCEPVFSEQHIYNETAQNSSTVSSDKINQADDAHSDYLVKATCSSPQKSTSEFYRIFNVANDYEFIQLPEKIIAGESWEMTIGGLKNKTPRRIEVDYDNCYFFQLMLIDGKGKRSYLRYNDYEEPIKQNNNEKSLDGNNCKGIDNKYDLESESSFFAASTEIDPEYTFKMPGLEKGNYYIRLYLASDDSFSSRNDNDSFILDRAFKICYEEDDDHACINTETSFTLPPPPLAPCDIIKYVDENNEIATIKITENTPDEIIKNAVECVQTKSSFGPLDTGAEGFIRTLLGLILSASGMIALALILRSGYQIMTSSGNAEALQEARERITSAIVGLIFIIFSMVILQVIGVDILQIPGFGN